MNVDTDRTVCLEDIKTMKQKNNWCSWCVRVFVGNDEAQWQTCGVGILTFKIGNKTINTLPQLRKEIKSDQKENPIELRAIVKIQEGLHSPSDKPEAEEAIKAKLREPENEQYILNCDLREANNFEWEKSKSIVFNSRYDYLLDSKR